MNWRWRWTEGLIGSAALVVKSFPVTRSAEQLTLSSNSNFVPGDRATTEGLKKITGVFNPTSVERSPSLIGNYHCESVALSSKLEDILSYPAGKAFACVNFLILNVLIYPPRPLEHTSHMPFAVFINDNFHRQDPSEAWKLGEYETFGAALSACKKNIDEFLVSNLEDGMSSGKLFERWLGFGESPSIVPQSEGAKFSAYDYAKIRCAELCSH